LKPNYQFEKRRRDQAKKQKQAEKRLRKLAGKAPEGEGAEPAQQGQVTPPSESENQV
jgi:hypothetical protein